MKLSRGFVAGVLAASLLAGCVGAAPQRRGTEGAPGGDGVGTAPGPLGARNVAPGENLGEQISAFVAGIDPSGAPASGAVSGAGGTANTGGTAGGAGGTGSEAAAHRLRVSTLVVGNLAYIGVDPAGLNGGAAGDLQSMISSRVTNAFPEIDSVFVTTDPDLVGRIATIAAEIESEMPISARISDIQTIMTRMTATGGAPAGAAPGGAGAAGAGR